MIFTPSSFPEKMKLCIRQNPSKYHFGNIHYMKDNFTTPAREVFLHSMDHKQLPLIKELQGKKQSLSENIKCENG